MSFDVVVIGAGPAGLMAAGQAASRGAKVLLLEKMDTHGRKLAITGKGRCNLTNIASLADFISHFSPDGRFLRQAFTQFFSDDLVSFFKDLGVDTVTERGGRVFPASEEARTIVQALTGWARSAGVEIKTRTAVKKLLVEGSAVTGVVTDTGRSIRTGAVIIATGGASYPGTGSTGDGYQLAETAGHTISPVQPALVPLQTAGPVAKTLQGLSLKNVKAHLVINNKRAVSAFGDLLFTHFGLSGPVILTLSRTAVSCLQEKKEVSVVIDLKPALDEKQLDTRLLRDLTAHGKRQYRSLLKGLLPSKLIGVCMEQTAIPAERTGHQLTAAERKTLRQWLKNFSFKVTGHRSFKEAVITAGGVAAKEIDPRTMASRKIPGLYFAGEVIDIDADTGGYNLQAAFSTGWLAGRSAAKAVQSS